MSVKLCQALLHSGCAVTLVLFVGEARAQCSDSRVAQFAKEGVTVVEIAEECEITTREVNQILKRIRERAGSEDQSTTANRKGAPAGTPLAPCSCWGPVDPNDRQPVASCATGYAQPQICNIPCPMGGFAWRGVCS